MKNKKNSINIKSMTRGCGMRILVMLGLIVSVIVAGCVDGGKDGNVTPIPKGTAIITPTATPTSDATPGTKTFVVRKGNKDPSSTNTPITINMSIPLSLSSENIAEVNIMVKSVNDAPNTKVDLVLPEGVTLVSDKSTWDVNLVKDVPVSLSAKIKIDTEDEITISAVAKKVIDADNVWGDEDVVYIGFEDTNTTPGAIKWQ